MQIYGKKDSRLTGFDYFCLGFATQQDNMPEENLRQYKP